jgi:hypothetical protein
MATIFRILSILTFILALILSGNNLITSNEYFELNVYGFFLLLIAQTEDLK